MLQDTTPEVEKMWHELWLKKTPQERVKCASLLFTSARKTIIASLPADLSPQELKQQVYWRTYGEALPEDFPFREDEK